MFDAKKEAEAIYEEICATSADRPFAFRSAQQMHRDIADWQAKNPGLLRLRQASPEINLAFLSDCTRWTRAELREPANFRVASTLHDAIVSAIEASSKPLPNALVVQLLTQLRERTAVRFFFPLNQFLTALTRDQVTEEIRAELVRLRLHYSPTASGKIEERVQKTRDLITLLLAAEGEAPVEDGRGPWSRTVFGEIAGFEEITRSGWEGLLAHCRALEQAVPSAKWKKQARELAQALGETDVCSALGRWLELGPTPGQPPEAISPIEDSSYQKGVVWLLALSQRPEAASAIADFGLACLRKIPMIGAVSQKVGFACVQALGSMECAEAVAQLARLRVKLKYAVAQRLIEKCLQEAAGRNGITVNELEDLAAPSYSLDAEGKREVAVGETRSTLSLSPDGQVGVAWCNAEGEALKSLPSRIKKEFPKEAKSVSALSKELEQAYGAQRYRLESAFVQPRVLTLGHWRRYFVDHPLLGFLGRRLIWIFSDDLGWEHAGLCFRGPDGQVRDARGEPLDISRATKVRLWHPLASEASEVRQWRQRVFELGMRQPFRQAYREIYEVTDDERQTSVYSNRFAGILMRQHQFSGLCRAKGWSYRLMGAGFDGFNVPTKLLPAWNMQAEFYVDLPSDRKPELAQSALSETSTAGINLFLSSDQVRFYRDQREIAIVDVPAIVYSEVMRDVDLFTIVSAVGEDEQWSDQGDRGTGLRGTHMDREELSALMALRIEMIARVLPLTPIAAQCKIEKGWLEVRGQLGTYRIQITWGEILRVTDSGYRRIVIPQKLLDKVPLDFGAFPLELDHRAEKVLREAYLLANDWHIDLPDLIRQLM